MKFTRAGSSADVVYPSTTSVVSQPCSQQTIYDPSARHPSAGLTPNAVTPTDSMQSSTRTRKSTTSLRFADPPATVFPIEPPETPRTSVDQSESLYLLPTLSRTDSAGSWRTQLERKKSIPISIRSVFRRRSNARTSMTESMTDSARTSRSSLRQYSGTPARDSQKAELAASVSALELHRQVSRELARQAGVRDELTSPQRKVEEEENAETGSLHAPKAPSPVPEPRVETSEPSSPTPALLVAVPASTPLPVQEAMSAEDKQANKHTRRRRWTDFWTGLRKTSRKRKRAAMQECQIV